MLELPKYFKDNQTEIQQAKLYAQIDLIMWLGVKNET